MSIETALSYAALILVDSEVEISAEKLLALAQKANVEVESIWAEIYAKALDGQNLKDLLFNISSGASTTHAPVAAGNDVKPVVEEKVEEDKEESDDDMGFGLFD